MQSFSINNNIISFENPLVMGILNLTPDSFFDGGKYINKSQINQRIDIIIKQGADIIDIGAYSSRPGADNIEEEEEYSRLLPALKILKNDYPHAIISIDTFRASIVEKVYSEFGEFIVNDISGGSMDDKMYEVVAKYNLPYIMMHIKGTPKDMQLNPTYNSVVDEVYSFFETRIKQLKNLGHNKIIIDPGFGFGKTLEHNYDILRNMEIYKNLACPILVGVSRKSMICRLLKCNPSEALTGTIAINTIALEKGANILRVHDVKEGNETVKIFNAFNKGIID